MHKVSIGDAVIFFLATIVVVSLATFIGEINEHVRSMEIENQKAQVLEIEGSIDVEIVEVCLSENAKICDRADFNKDGVVDITDVFLLKGISAYDFNGDGRVVLYFPAEEFSDYEAMSLCWGRSSADTSGCAPLDLDNNGVVGEGDATLMQEAAVFDVNQNSVIELR